MSWNDASEYVFPSTAGREKSGAAAPIGSPSYFTSSKEPPRSPIRAVDIGFRSSHPAVCDRDVHPHAPVCRFQDTNFITDPPDGAFPALLEVCHCHGRRFVSNRQRHRNFL